MDRNFRTTSCWCFVILVAVSSVAKSRVVFLQGPSAHHQPQSNYVVEQQQQTAEPIVRPRPRRVVVKCHPDRMEVVVQADMFDMGLEVDGEHLRLGSDSVSGGSSASCGAVPSGAAEFTIQSYLIDCGTKLSTTEDKIIYSNFLVYSPKPSSDGLIRLDAATIPVECHYEKKYAVDGIVLHPAWVSSVSTVSAEDQIDFNLILMTEDWHFQRGSYDYFVGDTIHFEVSANIGNHIPLRVYVDHCVATPTPDPHATLRYDFIENYGCLADAYLTSSSSHFLPRVEEHKLRFQLDAFRFYQEHSNQVYITCNVKAVPVFVPVSSQNRACSLIHNRWWSVDGNDQACESCSVGHLVGEHYPTEPTKTQSGTRSQPAVAPQDSSVPNRPEQPAASSVWLRPGSRHNKPQQSSTGLMKRAAQVKSEQTIQMGPIIILPTRKSDTVATDSKKARWSKNRSPSKSG